MESSADQSIDCHNAAQHLCLSFDYQSVVLRAACWCHTPQESGVNGLGFRGHMSQYGNSVL